MDQQIVRGASSQRGEIDLGLHSTPAPNAESFSVGVRPNTDLRTRSLNVPRRSDVSMACNSTASGESGACQNDA